MQHSITTSSNGNNGVRVFQEKNNPPADPHWAFLDEMEAPMWVDLTLECKFAYKDMDDEWFNTSHPFHQLSSKELIAVFSGLDEGRTKLDSGVAETSCPKIPTSVSKSRGRHYKSREWGKEKQKGTLSKRHPVKHLSSKGLLVKVRSDKAPKDEPCFRKANEKTCLGSSSDGESSLTEVAGMNSSKSVSNSVDMKNHGNSIASGIVVDSHTTSTITSDDTMQQQQQKSLEVPSRVLGHTSGLLSALRVTLRKSCVTRQASRFEVNHARQSEGRNSSSSKSSVCSSSNPGYERKNLTARMKKDKTPESRDVMRLSHTPNDKVLHHHKGSNVLVSHKVNICNFPTDVAKAKDVKGTASSKFAQAGKENEAGRIAVVQKSSGGDKNPTAAVKAKNRTISGKCSGTLRGPQVNVDWRPTLSQKLITVEKGAKVTVQAQNFTKRRGLKRGTEKLVAPEVRTSGRTETKGYANATGKVYLR